MDIDKINKCMGDPNEDKENPILQAEQTAQVLITIQSSLIIIP